jgi:hypothetical protein
MKISYKCQFCGKFCSKGDVDIFNTWWGCKQCRVDYNTTKGNLEIIHFKTKEQNNKFYVVHLSFKNNESNIYLWKKDKPYYHVTLVTSFNQILNFTPTNLQDKLKTYLLML